MSFSLQSLMSAVVPPETLVNLLRKALETSSKLKIENYTAIYNAENDTIHFYLNADPEPFAFDDSKKLLDLIRGTLAEKIDKKTMIVVGARVKYSKESITCDVKYITGVGEKEYKQIKIK